MVIDDNYLLLSKATEFNARLMKYFYNRLQLFLCIKDSNVPTVVCSSRKNIIQAYRERNQMPDTETARAFISEQSDGEKTNTIVFDARRYNFKEGNSYVPAEDIQELVQKYDFKYIIPLSDIYHELIHHVQYTYTSNDYINFLEAGADLYAYIISGQWNIDYLDACIAFWVVSTKICQNNEVQFYVMLRDAIIDDEFIQRHWLSNKNFVKMLGKKYDGNVNTFLQHFRKDFSDRKYEQDFYQFLQKIHSLIFYKY